MRTIKALACAAITVAGLATAVAQSNVYSLNVVGYYNLPLDAGKYYCIANQLNTTNNTLNALLPAPPVNFALYKWNLGLHRWDSYGFDEFDTVWYPDGLATLDPGEAVLVNSPTATTLTFVGEVEQGPALTTTVPAGNYVARSSIVPQAGTVATQLGFPQEINDSIYKWNVVLQRWDSYGFDEFDTVWYPEEPTFGVGEGMLVSKAGTSTQTTWTRNFTVQ